MLVEGPICLLAADERSGIAQASKVMGLDLIGHYLTDGVLIAAGQCQVVVAVPHEGSDG